MDSVAPPQPAEQPELLNLRLRTAGRAAANTQLRRNEQLENAHADLTPGKLLVRMDADAGRFVQTLTDASSEETLWRYPSEAQLAYSRAVKAYFAALNNVNNS